jgi:hypothetical protein
MPAASTYNAAATCSRERTGRDLRAIPRQAQTGAGPRALAAAEGARRRPGSSADLEINSKPATLKPSARWYESLLRGMGRSRYGSVH